MGGAARRGVGKVEPGLEKILDVGLNFKNCICPGAYIQDLTSG